MSSEIIVKTKEDLDRLVFRLVRLEMQFPGWVKITATRIANEEILDPLHDAMRTFNYSKKIIERTFIDNLVVDTEGFIDFELISDYQSESSFDVALAREEGTRDHFIRPIVRAFVSWIKDGIRLFSRGHWIRGITRSNVVDKIVDARTPIAQAKLEDEMSAFMERSITT